MFFVFLVCFIRVGLATNQGNEKRDEYTNDEYGITFYYPSVLKLSTDTSSGIKISFPNERDAFGSDTYVWAERCNVFPTAFHFTTGAERSGSFKKIIINGQEFIQDIHEEYAMGHVHWKVEQYATMQNSVCVEIRSDDFKPKPKMEVLKQLISSFRFQKKDKE